MPAWETATSRIVPAASVPARNAYAADGCCAELNCENPSSASLFMFAAMLGYAYHLPPLVDVAVASSTRPASRSAPAVSTLTHGAAGWVGVAAGSDIVCPHQI